MHRCVHENININQNEKVKYMFEKFHLLVDFNGTNNIYDFKSVWIWFCIWFKQNYLKSNLMGQYIFNSPR